MDHNEVKKIVAAFSTGLGISEERAFNVLRQAITTVSDGEQPVEDPIHYCPSLRHANIARQQEIYGGRPFGMLYWATALAGEVGEACNIIKKIERERLGHPGKRATKADLAKEMADVATYLDLLANEEDIDLNQAVIDNFNEASELLGSKVRIG
jgi:NTP pyrophosphatase (non-canonical NTP hydrolase)